VLDCLDFLVRRLLGEDPVDAQGGSHRERDHGMVARQHRHFSDAGASEGPEGTRCFNADRVFEEERPGQRLVHRDEDG
jgi:hypothetical protein